VRTKGKTEKWGTEKSERLANGDESRMTLRSAQRGTRRARKSPRKDLGELQSWLLRRRRGWLVVGGRGCRFLVEPGGVAVAEGEEGAVPASGAAEAVDSVGMVVDARVVARGTSERPGSRQLGGCDKRAQPATRDRSDQLHPRRYRCQRLQTLGSVYRMVSTARPKVFWRYGLRQW